jgi:hypothetical protein
LPTSNNDIQATYIRGIIQTDRDKATKFNDCLHFEGYGDITLPVRDAKGNLVRPGFVDLTPKFLEDDTEWYKVKYDRTQLLIFGITDTEGTAGRIGQMQPLFISYTKWKEGSSRPTFTAFCLGRIVGAGTLYYVLRSARTEQQLDAQVTEIFKHPTAFSIWHQGKSAEIIESADHAKTLDEANQWLEALKDCFEWEVSEALREKRADGFRAALVNNRTANTLSVCCQIMADGLICQAMAQIYNNCSRVLSKTSKAIRTQGKKYLRDIKSLQQFAATTLDAFTKGDLAYTWGINAPFRDYVDLAKAAVQGTWKPYFDGSTVSRTTLPAISGLPIEHQLVHGICYDYFSGSTFEDVMALLHQGGFDLEYSELWDLIPGSFILDWVFNISQVLDDYQATLEYWRYPIRYCWETDRCEGRITFHDSPIRVVLYSRKKVPPSSVLSAIQVGGEDILFDSNYQGTFSIRNVKELWCLVYQFLT